ncbi:MAG: hypothetical protein WAN12_09620 [Candidatus Acidiferrum sp.]
MIRLLHLRRGAARCAPSRHYLCHLKLFAQFFLTFSIFHPLSASAQNKGKPTLEVCYPGYTYPDTVPSLRDANLKNGRLVLFFDGCKPDDHVRLKNGKYERPYKDGYWEYIELRWVKPLESKAGESQFAIAYIVWASGAGSTNDEDFVQLLELKEGHLKVVQQFYFNVRGSRRAGAFFNPKTNLLTIKAINCWEHSCGTRLDVVQFKFDGGLLKQMRYWHEPLPYYD